MTAKDMVQPDVNVAANPAGAELWIRLLPCG